ncbi:hypothetical protein B0T10DRAFT_555963 [Thelonectria olida]|uniref:Zinc finger PHD-type domain-containing protein n=1 Tax=Thelonectria olida TaxID=1576542 RepID=A0A9P8WGN3_9HYPO|nr:hypothetical protein B0T10DRAFT_555963 [Thelonectria olida]
MKQSSYVPQFAADTSFILDRIKGASERSTKKEAETSIVAPHLKASTRLTPETKSPQSLSDTLLMPKYAISTALPIFLTAEAPDSIRVGVKRKRDSPDDAVDFAQNTIAFPWVGQPKSTPPTLAPQERGQTCVKCERHIQTTENTLVRCNQCLNSWHQQCHSPAITNGTILKTFVCTGCLTEQSQAISLQGKGSIQRQDETERLRRKRIATFPPNILPAKPELVGFLAGRAPSSSRAEYFSTKKKTDLLNILSLCDQLKPQLLTDILVSVSKKHPDLPIFDCPDWESQLPSAQRSAKSTPAEKPRQSHTVVLAKSKTKVKATKKILKRTRVIEVITDAPGVNEDRLPPTWPKANEGMYSKLASDIEDRSLLMDENDEESFSHFMVDSFGKQVMETVG